MMEKEFKLLTCFQDCVTIIFLSSSSSNYSEVNTDDNDWMVKGFKQFIN
jgi:hypothetical protein